MASIVEGIQNTIAENFGGGAKLAKAEDQFALADVPDQTGKVAVVTGGSEGIGYGCVHGLLSKGIKKVFILSLSEEVVNGAQKAVAEEMGQEAADKTVWIRCDLSDWSMIPGVAKQIQDSTDRLDVLINNAARGIMTQQITDYGVDLHMAMNHMGHVILTSHLLPLIKKTAEAGNTVRIVNLASNAHEMTPKDTKFASVEELNRELSPNPVYGRSKLAAILYSKYLTKHLHASHPKVLINASHPGFVQTRQSVEHIHEAYPLAGFGMSVLMAPFKKDQYEGALSTLYCATKTENSGEYICPPAIKEPGSDLARDADLAEQLMKLTREVVASKTKSASVDQGCPIMEDH